MAVHHKGWAIRNDTEFPVSRGIVRLEIERFSRPRPSRALIYWLLNDYDNAQRDLERAQKLEPSYLRWQDRFREFEEMF